jgi:hypothetical protein
VSFLSPAQPFHTPGQGRGQMPTSAPTCHITSPLLIKAVGGGVHDVCLPDQKQAGCCNPLTQLLRADPARGRKGKIKTWPHSRWADSAQRQWLWQLPRPQSQRGGGRELRGVGLAPGVWPAFTLAGAGQPQKNRSWTQGGHQPRTQKGGRLPDLGQVPPLPGSVFLSCRVLLVPLSDAEVGLQTLVLQWKSLATSSRSLFLEAAERGCCQAKEGILQTTFSMSLLNQKVGV